MPVLTKKGSSKACGWICSLWPSWVWESQHSSPGNTVSCSLGHSSISSFHRRSPEHQELRNLNWSARPSPCCHDNVFLSDLLWAPLGQTSRKSYASSVPREWLFVQSLEERYTIKFSFKLGKNATETYGMLQIAFRPSCMNQASVFEWHKRFKEGRSLWGMMRGVRGVRESIHQSWLAKGLGLGIELLCWGFKGVQEEIPSEEASTLQIGFHQDNAPVHISIVLTDYLT